MAAALLLSRQHNVVLIEAAGRLGGHARTVLAGHRGDQPVDTGFIVFNRVNYPHLCRMFDELDVPVTDSDMSFGVSIDGGRIEYGLKNLAAMLTQKRNALRPAFLRMIRDILRFNAQAGDYPFRPDTTIGEMIAGLGLGPWFRDYYLTPLSGAIWSTPVSGILDFPAAALVGFFRNHGLMSYTGQHQWMTVSGGSVEYVRRLERALLRNAVEIRTGAPVAGVRRTAFGAEVRCHAGEWEHFDEVVLASHADDTLALLADADPQERAALGGIRYQPNQAVLHADPNVMPRRRAAWSSWVYTEERGAARDRISLSYWMNNLQPIPQDDPMFVTLNPVRPIREAFVYDSTVFRHPVYDTATLAAQHAVGQLNGRRSTWFCGAWMKNGFHEDGFASAVDVATRLGTLVLERQAA
jgi:predicted NAD/FAD-binding protein